jgi:EPS-associated MarR family transcriptional regulator
LSLVPNLQKLVDLQEEITFEVLRRLYQAPEVSQRTLAGSINFSFQALVEKGWIKMQNFSQSKNKLRFAYLLTPAGVAEKSKLTAEFLRRKVAEHEDLQWEIKQLKSKLSSEFFPGNHD